jgi:hypothetical protein
MDDFNSIQDNPTTANVANFNEPSLAKSDDGVSDSLAIDGLLDKVLADAPAETPSSPETPTTETSSEEEPQPPAREASAPVIPQPGQKNAAPKAEAKAPAVQEKPVDPDIAKIEMPKGMSPSRSQQWKTLEGLAVERGTKLRELEPQLTQAQQQIAELTQKLEQVGKTVPEDVQKQLNELTEFRAMFDMTSDPEFQKTHFEPLAKIESSVMDLLKANGMPDNLMEIIQKQGITGTPNSGWKQILDALEEGNPIAKERLAKQLADFYNLAEQRDKELKNAPEKIKQWQEKKQTEYQSKQKEYQAKVNSEIDQLRKHFPQAQQKEIPPNADPTERAQIEKHNQDAQQLEKDFVSTFRAISSGDPKALTETVAAALLAVRQAGMIRQIHEASKQKDARVAQLEGELKKIQSASRTPRQTSPPSTPKTKPDYMGMSNDAAIEAQLKAMGV